MNINTSDWAQIPKGIILIKMFHERYQKHIHHLHFKFDDSEWFNQPKMPIVVSEESSSQMSDFWNWAKENLPVFEYPETVKEQEH